MASLTTLFLSALAGFSGIQSSVEIPAMPKGEKRSPDYKISLDGKDVPVWQAIAYNRDLGGRYSFAIVNSDGPITFSMSSKMRLNEAQLRPERLGASLRADRNIVRVTVPGPGQYSLEPEGPVRNLFLIVNPRRSEPSGDNIIRFGPGIHRVSGDVVRLTNNQTLFLDSGAVLQAAVVVENAQNVKIAGTGIIDGNRWNWKRGPQNQLVRIKNSRNVTVQDVTLRGSYGWTLVPYRSKGITIDNIKILNDRTLTDDGIDIANSQDVTIRNSLIRSDDDTIAMKGLRLDYDQDLKLDPVSDVLVENCILWGSRARSILIGHESEAREMSRIRIRNIDILYTAQTAFLLEPGEDMTIRDVEIENIRVNLSGRSQVAVLRPTVNVFMKYKQVPGRIDGVTFRDIEVTNAPSTQPLFLAKGHDESRSVKNVLIEAVRIMDFNARDIQYVRAERHAEVKSRDFQLNRGISDVGRLPVTKP